MNFIQQKIGLQTTQDVTKYIHPIFPVKMERRKKKLGTSMKKIENSFEPIIRQDY